MNIKDMNSTEDDTHCSPFLQGPQYNNIHVSGSNCKGTAADIIHDTIHTKNDKDDPYLIAESKITVENQRRLIKITEVCHGMHQDYYHGMSSTWSYPYYNFWGLTSPNELMYSLYDELRTIVKDCIPYKMMWMQTWVNFHKHDEVLDWHDHDWDYHGYLSIDPKNTTTVFKNWEVENKVGNIYLGRGHNKHKVVVNEPYEGYRITLGFDICVTPTKAVNECFGMIPL